MIVRNRRFPSGALRTLKGPSKGPLRVRQIVVECQRSALLIKKRFPKKFTELNLDFVCKSFLKSFEISLANETVQRKIND